MEQNPQELIDTRPMSAFQWGIVAIMIGLNALDGFDVLSISFASPGIATEWGIDRAALGIVLSMELIGMAVGSVLLGRIADRIGRRSTILWCLFVMTTGMFGAAFSSGINMLLGWRFFTGIGIGGMLAATNAAVAEASSLARRNLAVVLMAAGYPVGTVVGGAIAANLLEYFDWRSVFLFGGAVTALMIPLVLWRVPESIAFLIDHRPPDALRKINRLLVHMGHPQVDSLPEANHKTASSYADIFSSRFRRTTMLLTLAYLAHIMTFYFILKWIPKIVTDMGYPPAQAGAVLVWASVGGFIGSLLLGFLTVRVSVRVLAVMAMIASIGLVILFGQGAGSLGQLSFIAALAGFATNAGVVALYALLATSFPTSLKATATGLVIGIGRGGSALAPALAGILFTAGYGLPTVAMFMGLGSLVAAIAIFLLRPVENSST